MKTKGVLVVDDEKSMRELLKMDLEDEGFSVFEAKSGEDALEVLNVNEKKIFLVITDVYMGKMNGFSLLRKITKHFPLIKVIIMSSYSLGFLISKFPAEKIATNTNFIQKSFDSSELLKRVSFANN